MKKIDDWDNVEEPSAFVGLEPGPQVCVITAATDYPDKEYILIQYDILEGPFKGYYADLFKRLGGHWGGNMYASYKEKAIPFFKAKMTAIEKSNKGYKWDFDEKKLVGKIVVVNFREEEYINKFKEKASIVKGFEFRSLEALKAGDIEVKPTLTLSDQDIDEPDTPVEDKPEPSTQVPVVDNLPF